MWGVGKRVEAVLEIGSNCRAFYVLTALPLKVDATSRKDINATNLMLDTESRSGYVVNMHRFAITACRLCCKCCNMMALASVRFR